jgi:four helix bundle protein
MARIQSFEDIEAWQKARALTQAVYQASASGPFSRDFALRDQIRRAAVSVMSNIAEGFERDGNRELQQFLSLAKGSCGELRAQLYVAFDAGYTPEEMFRSLNQQALEVGRMLGAFIKYLRQSEMRGKKYN